MFDTRRRLKKLENEVAILRKYIMKSAKKLEPEKSTEEKLLCPVCGEGVLGQEIPFKYICFNCGWESMGI